MLSKVWGTRDMEKLVLKVDLIPLSNSFVKAQSARLPNELIHHYFHITNQVRFTFEF